MGISRQQGMQIAESTAWAKHGEKHQFWYTFGKPLLKVAALPLAVGTLLVAGGWWALGAVGDAVSDAQVSAPDVQAGTIRGWVYLVIPLLILGSVLTVARLDRFRSLGALVITLLALVVGWVVALGQIASATL